MAGLVEEGTVSSTMTGLVVPTFAMKTRISAQYSKRGLMEGLVKHTSQWPANKAPSFGREWMIPMQFGGNVIGKRPACMLYRFTVWKKNIIAASI